MDNISERILSGKTCSKREDESGFIHFIKIIKMMFRGRGQFTSKSVTY